MKYTEDIGHGGTLPWKGHFLQFACICSPFGHPTQFSAQVWLGLSYWKLLSGYQPPYIKNALLMF